MRAVVGNFGTDAPTTLQKRFAKPDITSAVTTPWYTFGAKSWNHPWPASPLPTRCQQPYCSIETATQALYLRVVCNVPHKLAAPQRQFRRVAAHTKEPTDWDHSRAISDSANRVGHAGAEWRARALRQIHELHRPGQRNDLWRCRFW